MIKYFLHTKVQKLFRISPKKKNLLFSFEHNWEHSRKYMKKKSGNSIWRSEQKREGKKKKIGKIKNVCERQWERESMKMQRKKNDRQMQ